MYHTQHKGRMTIGCHVLECQGGWQRGGRRQALSVDAVRFDLPDPLAQQIHALNNNYKQQQQQQQQGGGGGEQKVDDGGVVEGSGEGIRMLKTTTTTTTVATVDDDESLGQGLRHRHTHKLKRARAAAGSYLQLALHPCTCTHKKTNRHGLDAEGVGWYKVDGWTDTLDKVDGH
jgi:hypothetical protein